MYALRRGPRFRDDRHRVPPLGHRCAARAAVRVDGGALSSGGEMLRPPLARLLFVALLIPSAALADGSKLEAARNAYWKLDYEQARVLSESELATPGLEHAAFVEATKLDALSLAALGKEEAARDAFIALLECEPQ